jgi:alpha-glucosidase (family GH31 glycosyl hydrolase)
MDVGYPSLQGMYMQRMMYDGQRAINNKRVWSINRNFYLGDQRYAYGTWSGDISTGFQSMAAQRARMLKSLALGQTQWGMDGGGFSGTPSAENYARWIQFSAFTPIFRVHGGLGEQRQPWMYGEKAEAAAKAAIELRYTLMPYMYSFTRKATETGVGLVRPLAFAYPTDAKASENLESWMFGDSLLVAPVVTEGVSAKSIYLPAGTWYDYNTGAPLQGGRTITHQVDITNWRDIPIYVRDGAILATQPVLQYVEETPVRTVTFDVFPTARKSAFTYYEDDGSTYAYEDDAFFKQTLSTSTSATTSTIQFSTKSGTYVPDVNMYEVRAHKRVAKAVTVAGKPLLKFASLEAWQASGKAGWVQATDRFGATTYIRVPAGQATTIQIQH